jgi:hypothetical protein
MSYGVFLKIIFLNPLLLFTILDEIIPLRIFIGENLIYWGKFEEFFPNKEVPKFLQEFKNCLWKIKIL